MNMTMIVKYKVSSFLYLHNNFWYNSLGSTCTCQFLIVDTNVKLNFWFVGRLIVNHCKHHNSVIRSAIEVHELLMESYLISFQINLVPPQYLVGKVFISSRHSTIVSAGSYVVVRGLIFTLGILDQVGECLKDMDNTFRMAQDVLHLGHHLRRPARAPQPRWRPKTIRLRFRDFRNGPH